MKLVSPIWITKADSLLSSLSPMLDVAMLGVWEQGQVRARLRTLNYVV